MGIAGSATKPGTTDLFDASALVPELSSAIPLHIESGVTKELAQTTSSRAADTTPHYAGGQLNAPSGGCSTGFAVHDGSGNMRLMTAARATLIRRGATSTLCQSSADRFD